MSLSPIGNWSATDPVAAPNNGPMESLSMAPRGQATNGSSLVRAVIIGLMLGVLAMSWWVAFDRGRQWRDEALALSAERERTAIEIDRLRQQSDASADVVRRANDAVEAMMSALVDCSDESVACGVAYTNAEQLENLFAL